MGSKEPPGYFYGAFSYIRFLFFRGNNYSIKTNRAVRRSLRAGRDAGCVELMSSRTNGITSLLVTCNLFEKRWRCLLWCATFLSRSFRADNNLTQPIPHPFALCSPINLDHDVVYSDGNVNKHLWIKISGIDRKALDSLEKKRFNKNKITKRIIRISYRKRNQLLSLKSV